MDIKEQITELIYKSSTDTYKGVLIDFKTMTSLIEQIAAISDTRCCETLPCNYAEGYNDAIAKIKEEAKYIDKQ